MRIDRLRRLSPPHVQHHIGSLAPYPGQGLQGGARTWHLPAIIIDQNLAEAHHIFGLGIEQTDGPDMADQPVQSQIEHLLRRIRHGKQQPRRLVHADISRLRRQGHGHHQSIGVDMFKLALGFRL